MALDHNNLKEELAKFIIKEMAYTTQKQHLPAHGQTATDYVSNTWGVTVNICPVNTTVTVSKQKSMDNISLVLDRLIHGQYGTEGHTTTADYLQTETMSRKSNKQRVKRNENTFTLEITDEGLQNRLTQIAKNTSLTPLKPQERNK